MTDEKLAQKAEEVQRELNSWAVSSGVLMPGEQLVFSLRVQRVPTVIRDEHGGSDSSVSLNMDAEQFFTKNRLSARAKHVCAGTILVATAANCISYAIRMKKTDCEGIFTMRQFLEQYPNRAALSEIAGIGPKSALLLSDAIRSSRLSPEFGD